jgi:EmrB/QacA subfamily drug resistance transporter
MSAPSTTAPQPASAATPGPPVLSQRQIAVVFSTIVLGILLSALDQTIVSTALPTIVGDLGGAGHVSWVVTSYILTDTIATVLAGKLGDLLGRKVIFQVSIVIFLIGSVLSGLAGSMGTLIAWRAVQGIGAGGLAVTATALIGDLIPLRERGKYQGALGAVFGVTTVVGPLLGGLFTDHLSWRWVFYINVPIGIIVIALAARTIPSTLARVNPIIDYLGITFIAIGAGGLVLATSLGGNSYAWRSPMIIGMYAVALLAIVVFLFVEQRAADPMLPLRLFRDPVFSVVMVLALVVGFAMLGAITFLPTYLQYVKGVSATASGLRTLPMVLGLLATSIVAGTVVGRTGRYKIFPVAGSLIMGVGLFLLSLLGVGSGFWVVSLSMFVLGVGIGLSMQVLTIIVQNTARYEDLGVATSSVTFFRTLGSSFGTAVFGALYSNALGSRLGSALAASPGVDPKVVSTPQALHRYPRAQIAHILTAYADTIQIVFRYAIPVAAVAFVVSLFLKEVPLRGMSRSSATDLGDGFGMPDHTDSRQRLEIALGRLLRSEGRRELPAVRAGAGSSLGISDGWCVGQVRVRQHLGVPATLTEVAARTHVPAEVLRPAFDAAIADGYLTGTMDALDVTERGRAESDKVVVAVKAWITQRLAPDGGTDPAALDQALDNLARTVYTDDTPAISGRIPAEHRP